MGLKDLDLYAQQESRHAAQAGAVTQSLTSGLEENPDEYAKLLKLSAQTGVAPALAKDFKPELERRSKIDSMSVDEMVRTNPKTSLFLSKPENAAVAQDDVGVLKTIENTLRAVPAGLEQGWDKQRQMFLNYKEVIGTLSFAERAELTKLDKLAEQRSKEYSDGLPSWFKAASDVLGMSAYSLLDAAKFEGAVGLGTGAATGATLGLIGGPAAPVTATAGGTAGAAIGFKGGMTVGVVTNTYESSVGEVYDDLKKFKMPDGTMLDPTVARYAAIVAGVPNTALETFALGKALKLIPGADKVIGLVGKEQMKQILARPTMRAALTDIGKKYAVAVGAETSTEGLQKFISILTREIAQEASPGNFGSYDRKQLDEDVEAIVSEATEAFKATVILGGGGAGVKTYQARNEVKRAEQSQAVFEALGKAASESTTNQRIPPKFQEFVEEATKDGPVQNVYIDAQQFSTFFQEQGVDPEQVAQEAGITNYREAMAAGSDVVMPISQFASKIAPTPYLQGLMPDLRLHQGDLSLREAQAAQAEQDAIQSEIDALIAEQQAKGGGVTQAIQEIVTDVEGQLVATGSDPSTARSQATALRGVAVLVERDLRARAQRDGMEVSDEQVLEAVRTVWKGYGLDISRPMPEILKTSPTSDISIDPLLDALRAGRMPSDQQIFGKSLAEFVRGAGGLRATGETLSAQENMETRPFQKKLVQPDGMSMDRALQLAVEAGYFPGQDDGQLTETDFLNALDEDLRGGGRFSVNASDNDALALRESLNALGEYLDSLGIDLKAITDNAQVRSLIEQARNTPELQGVIEQLDQLVSRMGGNDAQLFQDGAQGDAGAAQEASDDVAAVESQGEVPAAVDEQSALDNVLKLARGQVWNKGRDLKVAIQQAVQAAAAQAGVDVGVPSPQSTDYLVRVGVRDALLALQQNPNAIGWYDVKTRQALSVMALVHPEIATDENARFAFVWALAVTSNGIKVGKNFELAEKAYRAYKDNQGVMPTDIQAGQAQKAINESLALFNDLKAQWGIDNLRRFMLTNFTVGEIAALSKKLKPGGEHAATTVKGAAILGPKIGNGFFSNLYGNFDALTMDRWLVRTWGRWTGTLIKQQPNQTGLARTRLEAAVAALRADPAEVERLTSVFGTQIPTEIDALALAIQEASVDPKLRAQFNQTELGTELRKAGNSLAKYLDGQKEAPAGPNERNYIRSVFGQMLSELQTRPEYKDLTMADLQAVLWYAEKRLYETAKEASDEVDATEGYNDEEAPDYANAASEVARQNGITERRIQNALKKEEQNGRTGTARADGTQGDSGPDGQQGQAQGFAPGQKRLFTGAVATHRVRSGRNADAQQSFSYARASDQGRGSPRVLKKLGVTYVGQWKAGKSLGTIFRANGITTPAFYELAQGDEKNAQRFVDAITASKQASGAMGAAVYVYPAQDYQGMRLFLAEDGLSGVAVKPDGDIVSVFSQGGAGRSVMEMAIAAGGTKLDAFETILPEYYSAHGFVATSRVAWDDTQAPAGWDKAALERYNGGQPDVVFMALDPRFMGDYSPKDGKRYEDYAKAAAAQQRAVNKIARAAQEAVTTLYQSAYQGSPTRGIKQMSTDFIGTGEGNQAFGWGLYFASKREIAEYYRTTLQKVKAKTGLLGREVDFDVDSLKSPWGRTIFKRLKGDLDAVIEELRTLGPQSLPENESADLLSDIATLENIKQRGGLRGTGQLYEVEIPEDSEMLLWDVGFGKMPENIREALVDLANSMDERSLFVRAAQNGDTGKALYQALAKDLGSPKAASQSLAEYGIKGIKYLDNTSRDAGDGTHNYVVFSGDDTAITNQFYQADDLADKRGFIQFGKERKFNIVLLEKANLSTFLHESGHFYLEVLGDLATAEGASEQVKEDYAKVLKFLGLESREQLTLDGKSKGSAEYKRAVEAHEKFARANEAYLMEGKAPVAELQPIFQRFKSWMLMVYKQLDALNVTLTNEVREVFDRIYATDVEIEAAKDEVNVKPVFLTAAEAGMSEQEFALYRESVANTTEAGKEALTAKLMRELQRERNSWWKEARAKMREDVTTEVDDQPVYRAFAALVAGKVNDETPVKLNKQALVERYGIDYVKRLPRGFQRIYTPDGGMDADAAAEMLGYDSGDALIEALVGMRDRKELIEAETDQRMRETYGDMMNDGSIADEAKIALHNAQRENVLMAELRALRRKQREVAPFVQAERNRQRAERQQARAATDTPPAQAFQRAAQGIIGQTAVRDLDPYRYLQAARKAAKQAFSAMAKGDYQLAADVKQKELLNHYLYLEANKAREEADKILKYAQKFDKGTTREKMGKAGASYLEQIDAILDRYEFRRVPLSKLDRRASLAEWIAQEEAAGNEPSISAVLLNESRLVNYRQVPIDELRAVYDALRNIEHLARLKNKLLTKQAEIEFQDAIAELVASAENMTAGKGDKPVGQRKPLPLDMSAMTLREKAGDKVSRLDAMLVKMEQLVEWLDNGNVNGPWHTYLWNPIAQAQDNELNITRALTERLSSSLEQMPKAQRLAMLDTFEIPGMGKVTRKFLISVALNMGNQGNIDKMMRGMGWDMGVIEAALAKLNDADWTFVQETWDTINSLWPQIAELEKRMTGLEPPKVEAQPYEVRDADGNVTRTLAGGYYPLVYDPRKSEQGAKQETGNLGQMFEEGYVRATTPKGHTQARSEGFAAPMLFDFEQVITQHMAKVVKDLTHREAVVQANKILTNPEIRNVLQETLGEQYEKQFLPWLRSVVNDRNGGSTQGLADFSRWMMSARANVVVAVMGFKATTAIAQITGLSQSLDKVKGRYLSQALLEFLRHPVALTRTVRELSSEMRNRSNTLDRDIRDQLRNLTGQNSKWAQAQRFAFHGIAIADAMVSVPTWMGAYRQALDAGASEETARLEADAAVRLTQGAGGAKDLAAVQRNNELAKSLTMFYSYFSVLYNRMRDMGRDVQEIRDMPRFMSRVFFTVMVPAVIGELILGRGPDDDEDPAGWAIRKVLLYPLMSVPLLRDVASSIDSGYDYRFSPIATVFEKIGSLAKSTGKLIEKGGEEWDQYALKVAETIGYVFGVAGTAQISATGKYLWRVSEGEEKPENLAELLFYATVGKRKED